ncbi:hypothetical protein PUP72_16915 [Pseudomonas synxantha]|nr:hypothetical protein [Pseudomonas synxantha]WDG40335.1 hypothetical protein PUP72_16915 [Pseudomonas synxantha]
MKTKLPSMSIIRGLLFTYDIENTDDLEREKIISSTNINNDEELVKLFDELTKPEFLFYTRNEQVWFIDSISHFLTIDDNFDAVFKTMSTYFSAPVTDQKKFMQILLSCLKNYHNESNLNF